MKTESPESLLEQFFASFNRWDIDAVLALYEPRGALVAQPGMVAQGSAAVREGLGAFLAMKPRMQRESSQVVVVDDVALALTRWTLSGVGADGAAIELRGEATDVFRRQADGRWLVVLDNPWGVSLLAAGGAS